LSSHNQAVKDHDPRGFVAIVERTLSNPLPLVPASAGNIIQRPDANAADRRRRSASLRVANRCWLALGILALGAMPFYPNELTSFVILITSTFVTFVLVDALRRDGKTRPGGLLLCAVVDATIYGLMLFNYHHHGFRDLESNLTRVSAYAMMGTVIVFAGALVGPRAALAFALFNTGLLVLSAILVDVRLGPKLSIPCFWWLLAVAVWLYEREVTRALSALQSAHSSLELRVEERTHDLTATLERLDRSRRETEAANAELESFSYSVAHDLRGPLRRIRGFAGMLMEDYGTRLEDGARKCLDVIQDQSDRMEHLIADLMRLAKVSRMTLDLQEVDLSAIAAEIAAEFRSKDPARGVEWSITPGLRRSADPGLARVILENLLGNAWKFTSKTAVARIEVGTLQDVPGGPIFVRDNGAGFDPAFAGKLFQPFERLHSDSEFAGNGIGLATVARVVKRHGGSISATGAVGRGATFTFTL
jgi:signal transduction histidine kinase